MELGLNGKSVVITGGSKGIGLACAQAFLAEGARVSIVSRSRANLDAALSQLPGAEGHAADMSDAAAAAGVLERIEARSGPIDVLINSAGAARRTPPDELTADAYRAAMDAKYFSYVNAIDPVVKRMAARGRGVIVNIIGGGGKVATPIHVPGGAANAALMLVTAGLAAAYAGRGVRIVGVNPGITQTERLDEGIAADARLSGIAPDEARQRMLQRIPMGRFAEADEIAAAVLFFASDKASYVTGITLGMDGASTTVVI